MQSISVAKRIFLGYALLTAVILVGSALAILEIQRLSGGFDQYRLTADQTLRVNTFVEHLTDAEEASLRYRITSENAHAEAALSHISTIGQLATNLSVFQEDPALIAELEAIVSLTQEFEGAFNILRQQNTLIHTLDRDMENHGIAARDALIEMRDMATNTNNVGLLELQAKAQESLLSFLFATKQYLASEDQAHATSAKVHLKDTREHLANALINAEAIMFPAFRDPAVEVVTTAITSADALEPLLEQVGAATITLVDARTSKVDRLGPQMSERLDTLAQSIVAKQEQVGRVSQRMVETGLTAAPIIAVFATILAVMVAMVVSRWITLPLKRLSHQTRELAEGQVDIEVTGANYNHEIGQMARALETFKQAYKDRAAAEEETQRIQEAQQDVVKVLARGLQDLADGELTTRITRDLDPKYQQLAENFNAALAQIHNTIKSVLDVTMHLDTKAGEIREGSVSLSQRTENQAATLEETAASLQELTTGVNTAAERSRQIEETVQTARQDAHESQTVVNDAVAAMGNIQSASEQISQITEVISDISFQTNLLALNAGVEAARAGEAGRGFAVVASEVRALAQRSSDAAREVSELIQDSTRKVDEGTKLVQGAGEALRSIIQKVDGISESIIEISEGAVNQAAGISELNAGVGQLDKVTQQNAGMVQTSRMQSDELVEAAQNLARMMRAFNVDEDKTRHVMAENAPSGVEVRNEPSQSDAKNQQPTEVSMAATAA